MQVRAGRRARPILGPSDPRPVPQSATRPFPVLCLTHSGAVRPQTRAAVSDKVLPGSVPPPGA